MQTYFPLLAFSATFWPSHSTENMVFADLELGITGEKIRPSLPLSGTCKTKKVKQVNLEGPKFLVNQIGQDIWNEMYSNQWFITICYYFPSYAWKQLSLLF